MSMSDSSSRVGEYRASGLVVYPSLFTEFEVSRLRAVLPEVLAENSPRRVLEKSGEVRSVYGSHKTHPLLAALVRHPRLVQPARAFLGGEVYVYQFKINAKAAFSGDVWDWHQDYIFWREEDGLPEPHVTTAVVFVDEVTEFNGPLYFIPSSHQEGVLATAARTESQSAIYDGAPDWIANLTADLKYALPPDAVTRLAKRHGLVAPKGPAGTTVFFDANLLHASPNNLSPSPRSLALITYCRTDVVAGPVPSPRPEFLASRDPRPLVPGTDDSLFATHDSEETSDDDEA